MGTSTGVELGMNDGHDVDYRKLNDTALKQVASRCGMPVAALRYIMERGGTQPVADYLNDDWKHKYQQHEGKAFIRFSDKGDVRAVLSDSYTTFDHDVMLAMVADVIDEKNDTSRIHRQYRSDDWMHVTAITREAGDGDHGLGFRYSNSETGHGSGTLMAFLHRGTCDNGMIFGFTEIAAFRRRHVGDLDLKEARRMIEDAYSVALLDGQHLLEAVSRLRSVGITDDDQVRLIYQLAKDEGITQHEAATWHAAASDVEHDGTTFGLVQGLTRAAQLSGTERELELQQTAGNMVARGVQRDLDLIEARWVARIDNASMHVDTEAARKWLTEYTPAIVQ
jgi:hypothetical protein